MHIHILGICGTFMGSLALLARDLGMKVTGSDAQVLERAWKDAPSFAAAACSAACKACGNARLLSPAASK